MPSAKQVAAAVQRHRATGLWLLVPGVVGLIVAGIGAALTVGIQVTGWVVVGLIALIFITAGAISIRRYRATRRAIITYPWRSTAFAYDQVLHVGGGYVGLIFLRDPDNGREAVLRVAARHPQQALWQITEQTVPFAGDLTTGGAVYVATTGELLSMQPFTSTAWRRFLVRRLVAGDGSLSANGPSGPAISSHSTTSTISGAAPPDAASTPTPYAATTDRNLPR